MPNQGGSDGSSPLTFTRRTLQAAARSLEAEYEGVNPHKFYRGLRSNLAHLRGHEDTSYDVVGQRSRDLRFDPEAAGERTGAFTARMQARSDTPALGDAIVEHRPWGPHGAGLTVLGLLVLVFGPLFAPLWFAGAGLALAGVGLFSIEREGRVPLERRDVLSVLVEGEARESTRRTGTGRRSELSAEMGTCYAGDVFLTIPPDRVPELSWSLRAELGNRRSRWAEALSTREPHTAADRGIATGFVDALRAWALLDASWTRARIEDLQREVRRTVPLRQAHTELLSRLRATDVRDRELDRLGREIETLANEMSAYAEQERVPSAVDGAGTRDVIDGPASARARMKPREPPLRPRPRRQLEEPHGIRRAEPGATRS